MGIFDGLPVPPDKAYLREELSRIDESWAAARFDSLPHVVHILTSKDREAEALVLKEQSDVVEDVVDEVVQSYHIGFNKAIQNYSQILRLFSESAESITALKIDLAEAKKRLGNRNKQLHQLWYRSVTLRHIISLLDQIEGIAKVPARIEKLIAEKQFYAAVQLHAHSSLMLERESLQTVGALQDVRSELTKLRGVVFYKILEDLHAHLYNKGEHGSVASSMHERYDELPTTVAVTFTMSNSQSLSRRTKLMKGDNHSFADGPYRPSSIDGSSFDGPDEDLDISDEATPDGHIGSMRANGGNGNMKDIKIVSHQIPSWLSNSTPDEFIEIIKKSDAPLHVKYLQTMVECLCMLGKVAAAGAILCQRLRPTIHDIIASKIKAYSELVNSSRSSNDQTALTRGLHSVKGQLERYQLSKQKRQNGMSLSRTLLAVSPVSPVMAPTGKAQAAAKELLDSILDILVQIFENHVIVGELLEVKTAQNGDMNTPRSLTADANWSPDSEASQVTGGYSIGLSLTVLQSECQQLICEILRATPEAASADASVQTARLASKVPSKGKKDGSEEGLAFAFRFTDATISIPNQGSVDLIRQGWNRKGPNVLQEGYGSAAVLPEQGIYLAASVYRPVLQFTDKVASMLPKKYSQLGNDGLLAFVENFVKDHFLPTMFVDYRKGVQQAISSPAAFRPRAHTVAPYTPSIEKGRPVLQGLLAIDFLAKEVLGWAQAMPKFAGDLVKFVQTFLERTYERCRTSYMEAVLEKQSYMLIGRHDIEKLMRFDPSNAYLPNSVGESNMVNSASDAESLEIESELNELLFNLRPIKQENLIHDDNKLILLASLSDSLEYVADSIERLGKITSQSPNQVADKGKTLASFADDYRKLAIDCLKVLRVEMQLETIFHMQEMTSRVYLEDQDAEEPDDFIISLTAQITRRDEEMAPFVARAKQNYIFGGICSVAASASIKALADMKSINLFGVQQICRNSIALEQAIAAIPSIDSEAVQQRLDHVRTYYELLNMPYEALLAFITEHEGLFTAAEYINLLKVNVSGRETPPDAQDRVLHILSH
ncbi:PREDICTED: exocyst complex component SEC8-like isoform X1 [Populus euphratica]|uniref:Exocyst complex component Sec8 n=1 Tax=Populus euphratica TaxID=75702 RepID=A0AAJ6ULG7_POPEU|nr:PREDICTED: exocyst complex component SEC8-like isoform X1 [Populus euphratica]XP_011031679.1 PREDICTED: exocyst complex component SEC8-like isoform X1 [Populus euphratica]XP_011031680.1 PREDICTED: exocyst complex component SEC8-like isoform X1 [Populus euphratica]